MSFWEQVLEAQPVLIDAAAHDRQLAWTSHLPQAVASALAKALADRGLGRRVVRHRRPRHHPAGREQPRHVDRHPPLQSVPRWSRRCRPPRRASPSCVGSGRRRRRRRASGLPGGRAALPRGPGPMIVARQRAGARRQEHHPPRLAVRRAGARHEPRRRRAHLARRPQHGAACSGSSAPRSRRSGRAARCPSRAGAGSAVPGAMLDCGNSGTTTRLLLGSAGRAPFRRDADRRRLAPPPADAPGHRAAVPDGRAVRPSTAVTACRSRSAAGRWSPLRYEMPRLERADQERAAARRRWPAGSRSSCGSRTAARATTPSGCSARSATGWTRRTAGSASRREAGSSRSRSRFPAIRRRRRSSSAPPCWPKRASSASLAWA